jgi:hypothetical protein
MTTLPPDLVQAYTETNYNLAANMITVNVGVHNPQLLQLLAKYQPSCAAIITAYNPYSIPHTLEQNINLNLSLAQDIAAYHTILCSGVHPSNNWPPEASYMILDITQQDATTIATKYQQNAYIWITDSTVPELILLK